MSSLGSPSPFFLAGKKGYEVKRSLRFNGADGPYLENTPSSHSNKRKMTFSFWFKRAVNTNFVSIFRAYGNASNRHSLDFVSGGSIRLWGNYNGSVAMTVQTTQLFRDFSAWYHFVLVLDTEQGTASNRAKMYVNGVQITDFSNSSYPSQNFDFGFNDQNAATQIGVPSDTGCNYYIAEFQEIDGLALDPSYFAETDAITGQWNPKKYTGSYGTNGFYLNFSDNSGTTATTLGKDSSGVGRNFTPNNFSVAAGVNNDSLEDTPTNNFATFNPLIRNVNTFSEGNLQVTMTSSAPASFYSTIGASSGKYYMEFLVKSVSNYPIGISGSTQDSNYFSLGNQIGFWLSSTYTRVFRNGSNITANSEVVGNFETGVEGSSTGWAVDDIAGLALDMDNKIIYLYKGSTQVGSVNFSTFNYSTVFFGGGNYINGNVYIGNFGQRPFTYTPPTGYKSLCSKNLPDPTIKLPNKHFGTINFSGNGNNNRTVTDANSVDFTPDFAWFKERTGNNWHGLVNSVIGSTQVIWTNSTDAEGTATNGVESFTENGMIVGDFAAINDSGEDYFAHLWNAGDTDGKTYAVTVVSDSGNKYRFDGFGTSAVTLDLAEGGTYIFDQSDSSNATHPLRFYTAADKTGGEYTTGVTTAGTPGQAGAYTQIVVAASAPTLYYQCSAHANMGGQVNTNSTTGSSNFDGSIQTTVKANPTAGFSIVSYTGNNTAGATIGHGLGVKPEVVIVARRSNTSNRVFRLDFGPSKDGHYLFLNQSSLEQTGNDMFNSTNPTSTSITIGTAAATNNNGGTHIAYVFAEVEGFSKGDFYVGNGSNDGTFVYTGFKPAFLLIKDTQGTEWWQLQNIKSFEGNPTNKIIFPNVNNSEFTGSGGDVEKDILSNGFKLRGTSNGANKNNNYYYYLAFAESPFKNARAR